MAEQESTSSVEAQWQAFMDAAAGACLTSETMAQLGRGAALLLRVAKLGSSPDARAAERWLSTMVHTSALACVALEDVQ